MKVVFKIASGKRAEAENIVKSDDMISRQSITVRASESLGLSGKLGSCYVMIIDGSDEAVERAKELLKDMAEIIEDNQAVIDKIKEEEDAATEGFGNIFG